MATNAGTPGSALPLDAVREGQCRSDRAGGVFATLKLSWCTGQKEERALWLRWDVKCRRNATEAGMTFYRAADRLLSTHPAALSLAENLRETTMHDQENKNCASRHLLSHDQSVP